MNKDEARDYLESLGMKYGKDFSDETIKELTDGKEEGKDE